MMGEQLGHYGRRISPIHCKSGRFSELWSNSFLGIPHLNSSNLQTAGQSFYGPSEPPAVVRIDNRDFPIEQMSRATMSVLSKYMTSERALMWLPVVGDGPLLATQPTALNDPFECAVQKGSVQPNDDNRLLAQALSNLNGTTPVTERDVRKARLDKLFSSNVQCVSASPCYPSNHPGG